MLGLETTESPHNPILELLHLPAPSADADLLTHTKASSRPGSPLEPDEEGSDTEPEDALGSSDGDGDATEDEFKSDERSDQDQGVKPSLVARSDQLATGNFLLKRPRRCYDGAPVRPGPAVSVPPSINRFLRDYQREGVQFFYERYCEGRGGVLGDDMGLGTSNNIVACSRMNS